MTVPWMTEVLEPAFIDGLNRLSLVRRSSAREFSEGARGITRHTSGLDWVGHRPYEQGDDLRYLDWHLWMRIGRPYVRSFLAERTQRLDILIDTSRSMTIGKPSKVDVARALAFVFTYIVQSAGERVGATVFSDRPMASFQVTKGPSGIARLINFLANAPAGGMTSIAANMRSFAAGSRDTGRVILISDLLDDNYEEGLRVLRDRGFEVMVIRLRASCDEEPDISEMQVRIVDIETNARRTIDCGPSELQRYRRRRLAESEATAAFCARSMIKFISLGTWKDLTELVFHDLRVAGFFV